MDYLFANLLVAWLYLHAYIVYVSREDSSDSADWGYKLKSSVQAHNDLNHLGLDVRKPFFGV